MSVLRSFRFHRLAGTIASLLFVLSGPLVAQTAPSGGSTTLTPGNLMCPNANIWGPSIVTKICWSCLFPLRIMGVLQLGSGTAPPSASDRAKCICAGEGGIPTIGITEGMWAPTQLVELVRVPYCSPSLGGTRIRNSYKQWGMVDGSDDGSSSNQYLNWHIFSFPLYQILTLMEAPECNAGGYQDFDLLYMSELDPTSSEDELAMFVEPETAVAANPLLMAACPVDCAAAAVSFPIDRMWWCAGCWGNLYPFTGNVPSGGSAPRVSSLVATRALAALHRRGLEWRTMGNDVLCGGQIDPMIPKTQYKFSMLFPVPEASSANRVLKPATTAGTGNGQIDNFQYSQGCCHNIGVPTMMWGEWRSIPGSGEDFVYGLWRWTDCCIR